MTSVLLRAVIVVTLDCNRKALPGQRFTTNLEHAARLLREGAAVVVDERDSASIAGRELDMQRGMHRRVRGGFGAHSPWQPWRPLG